jgi:hypothetical protein
VIFWVTITGADLDTTVITGARPATGDGSKANEIVRYEIGPRASESGPSSRCNPVTGPLSAILITFQRELNLTTRLILILSADRAVRIVAAPKEPAAR